MSTSCRPAPGAVAWTAGYSIGGTSPKNLTLTSGSIIANADAILTAPLVASNGITKSGAGYRINARMFLPRDVSLSQPLVSNLETANFGENKVTVPPNETHDMSANVRVEPA